MPCPCEGDGNIAKDREHVFLRFIGGEDKVGKLRGRWRTYETGRIYRRFPANANFEAYPYWAPATEEEFCDQVEARAKTEAEDALAKAEALSSTASDQGDVASSAGHETDISMSSPESNGGLTEEFGAGPTEEGLIRGMGDTLLKHYITNNGGKVDGRWGREKLIQEALKL